MRRLFLVAALALAMPMAACNSLASLPPSPSNAANATVLDEQLALGVEASYKAARTALELYVDTGQLKGANAAKARKLNAQAYAAVKATRAAYAAGNADSYITAATTATHGVSALLSALHPAATGSN